MITNHLKTKVEPTLDSHVSASKFQKTYII